MAIKVAFILNAKKEITLTAGQRNKDDSLEEKITIVNKENNETFLNIGYANAPEISLAGLYVKNPNKISDDLTIAYYLPSEEKAKDAKLLDISLAKVHTSILPRQKAEENYIWHYKIESRKNVVETKFFDTGFHPPLKESDISIHLNYLCNYNYEGYIVSNLIFNYKTAYYVEDEWGFSLLEKDGILED